MPSQVARRHHRERACGGDAQQLTAADRTRQLPHPDVVAADDGGEHLPERHQRQARGRAIVAAYRYW